MHYASPESVGISSRDLLSFYKELDAYHLSTHSVMMARGDSIVTECYYAPFHKDFKHRMYSVSKSFVSVAVGFCIEDGLLSLDDKMIDFFPEYKNGNCDGRVLSASIREMLLMETSMESNVSWFKSGTSDRVEVYFRKCSDKYPHTLYRYDSSGSYMLAVIVEKLTGKPFLEYLKEKVLIDIGFSKDAYCLMAPGGYSFGDSGVMCTTGDLLRFARFVLNYGAFGGKRYMNEDYLRAATSMQVSNEDYGFALHGSYGYGYQFWQAPKGCFAMLGMGTQVALCDPKHDFVFAINSDNQGNTSHYEQLYEALYRNVIGRISDTPLPEDPEGNTALAEYVASRKLFALDGKTESPFKKEIDGRTYRCEENPMGIKWFRISFMGNAGTFEYENAQGEKSFPFGLGHNAFAKFPEENYADLTATVPEKGHRYDAAFSADFPEEQKLRIRVQIIDKYFGNLAIVCGFRDKDHVSVRMKKTAEAFLEESSGIMNATAE